MELLSIIACGVLSLVPAAALFPFAYQKVTPRSRLGAAAFAWTLGQFLAGLILLFVATLLTGTLTNPLRWAVIILLVGFSMVIVRSRYRSASRGCAFRRNDGVAVAHKVSPWWEEALLLSVFVFFSYVLYRQHVQVVDGTLVRSLLYWDFEAHFRIIQSFAFGDNFPPTSESAAGLPMFYHYFFDLVIASYSAVGLDLADSILLVSVLSLTALLALARSLCLEMFDKRAGALLVPLLVVTSGTMRWIVDFEVMSVRGFEHFWKLIAWPAAAYYLPVTRPDGYMFNGNWFGIFYFVAERHLVFACAALLVALLLVRIHRSLAVWQCMLIGVGMALFFRWHSYVFLLMAVPIAAACLYSSFERRALAMLGSFVTVAGCLVYLVRASLRNGDWFSPVVFEYPMLNFSFTNHEGLSAWPTYAFLRFYIYGLGPKVVLSGYALAVLLKRRREDALLVGATLLAALLLTNSLQLLPGSINENHKWQRPLVVLIDVVAGGGLGLLLSLRVGAWKLLVIPVALLTVYAGSVELVPYMRKIPIRPFAAYPSQFVEVLRSESSPGSVFVSRHHREVLLAGRKLYVASDKVIGGVVSPLRVLKFKFFERVRRTTALYDSTDLHQFCSAAKALKVDFVEFDAGNISQRLLSRLAPLPRFVIPRGTAKDSFDLVYISVKGCDSTSVQ